MRHAQTDRWRLSSISTTATDPDTGAPRTEQVATYEYSADSVGRLTKVTDAKTGLAVQYGYDADGLLASVTPPGEEPHTVTYQPHVDDKTKGRIRTSSRAALPGTATWTIVYSDRTFNGANPWNLDSTEVAKWGQTAVPYRATAILPPDVTFGVDQATLSKASISYLDALGREINHAEPGGRISAIDLDKWGNVTRSLSPANRKAALTPASGTTQDAANRLATITTYGQNSRNLPRPVRVVGPEHDVRLAGGQTVRGRSLSITAYDENIPASDPKMPYDLPTTTQSGVLAGMDAAGNGGTAQELRTTKTEYQLSTKTPVTVTADAGGPLESVRRLIVDAQGNERERRQPSNPGTASATTAGSSTDAPTTVKTAYYTSSTNPDNAACGSRPEWVGLVCEVGPAGSQPTSGTRKLPSKRFEYDYWRRPRKVVETATTSAGVTELRTTTTTFDGKGRPLEETVKGSLANDPNDVGQTGTPIDMVRHVYDNTTGQETETQQVDSAGIVLRRVKRTFDTLGRLATYEDSTGGKEVTTFDGLSRASTVTQYNGATVLGTQTYTYDAVTGQVTGIKDSSLDATTPMTATYDLDGRPTGVTYPSGVQKYLGYDETGELTTERYTKTTNCTSGCVWYEDVVSRSGLGELATDQSTLGNRAYSYDSLGRLASVSDTPAGQPCTTRTYGYDANSNRTSRRSNTASAVGSACPAAGGTGGSVVTSAYDSSDRLTSANGYGLGSGAVTYDAWGRTRNLPKQASGGGLGVDSTYFVNDLARTIVNGSVTITNELDPMDRVRSRQTQTNGQATVPLETYAYGDDTDAPIFSRTATAAAPNTQTGWTRYVQDPTGDLAVQITSAGAKNLQVSNVRGDVVAEIAATATATGLGAKFAVDEFGVPTGTTMGFRKYGFIGGKQRESLLYGNVIAMGARTYSPHAGRFLQVDPVAGGSANAYDYVNQDPVNEVDLDGECAPCLRMVPKLLKAAKSLGKKTPTVRRRARDLTRAARYLGSKDVLSGLTKLAFSKYGAGVKKAVEWFARTKAGKVVVGLVRAIYPNGAKWAEGGLRLGKGNIPGVKGPRYRLSWAPKGQALNKVNQAEQKTGIPVRSNMHWDLGPW